MFVGGGVGTADPDVAGSGDFGPALSPHAWRPKRAAAPLRTRTDATPTKAKRRLEAEGGVFMIASLPSPWDQRTLSPSRFLATFSAFSLSSLIAASLR